MLPPPCALYLPHIHQPPEVAVLHTYLLAVNILTFALFGIDKWKAVHDQWRIPVRTLLGFSLIGGAAGGLLAMYTFRHKTHRRQFTVGLPLMLLAHAALLVYLG